MKKLKLLGFVIILSLSADTAFCQKDKGQTSMATKAMPEASAGDIFKTIFRYILANSSDVAKMFNSLPACTAAKTTEDMKTCVAAIKNMKATDGTPLYKKSLIQGFLVSGLELGCSANWASNTCKDIKTRAACGVVACNLDMQTNVKNCMSKHNDACANYMIQ